MCNGVQEDTRRHTVEEEEEEEEEEKGSRRRRKERERQKDRQKKGYLITISVFVLSFSSSLEILRNPKD
jgi:hypothetical protein